MRDRLTQINAWERGAPSEGIVPNASRRLTQSNACQRDAPFEAPSAM